MFNTRSAIRAVGLLLSMQLMVACSTPYQRLAFTGGYQEKQRKYNEYDLLISVNGYTDWDRTIDYALLRASEISLENGFSYFMLIDRASSQVMSIEEFSHERKTNGYDRGGSWTQPIVRMFRRRPVFGHDYYYDARQQLKTIAAKLQIKELQNRKFPGDIGELCLAT